MSSTQCVYVPVEHFQVIVKKLYTSSGIPSYYHTVEITYIQVFTGVHTIHTCIHILEQQRDCGEQQRTNFSVSVTVVIDTLCSFVSFSGIFSYTFSENTPDTTSIHTYMYVYQIIKIYHFVLALPTQQLTLQQSLSMLEWMQEYNSFVPLVLLAC